MGGACGVETQKGVEEISELQETRRSCWDRGRQNNRRGRGMEVVERIRLMRVMEGQRGTEGGQWGLMDRGDVEGVQ